MPPATSPEVNRPATAVDAVADAYLTAFTALDPIEATTMGVAGHDHELPDLSPDGLAEVSQLRRRTLAELAATEPVDSCDRITIAALREQLTVSELLRDSGAEESRLNNIHSPVQDVRMVFDLMPTETVDDWATIAARLTQVPAALAGYAASLRLAAARGDVAPQRQVFAGIDEAAKNGAVDGFFAKYVASAASAQLSPALTADLERAANEAALSYLEVASVLREEILPHSSAIDAAGAERYALASRQFLGTQLDLPETYAWGQSELARIDGVIRETLDRIMPGASLAEVIATLNADPARKLYGTDALAKWMQGKSDEAVESLGVSHFDIPGPIRTLECKIAPTKQGGIYYTGPSEDFSRPGQMWWSVPEGDTEFSTWSELTIVYHEGVPGHHLQIAQTVYRRELLNRWRRMGSWSSGHGEGWALYAERLMADLGYLDDPADLLGMLLAQSWRAARVVIDVGYHCGFDAPVEVGGGPWDYDKAWTYLGAHCNMSEQVRRFELERYLGWPGQATSYKVGERFWLQLRDDARAAAEGRGEAFDLTAFHRSALDVGGVGLDTLRAAVLGEL
jgi:uncharacterized protein (DUF885 family)